MDSNTVPARHTPKHTHVCILTCPEAHIPESVPRSLILGILDLGKIYMVGSEFTINIWQLLCRIIALVHRVDQLSICQSKFSVLIPSGVYLLGLNCLLLTMTKGYCFLEKTYLPCSGIYAEAAFSAEPSSAPPSLPSRVLPAHSGLTLIVPYHVYSCILFVVCLYQLNKDTVLFVFLSVLSLASQQALSKYQNVCISGLVCLFSTWYFYINTTKVLILSALGNCIQEPFFLLSF